MDDMSQRNGMPCPRCGVGLLMTDRQGIEIDYCPKCRGVWLDRGELDKIIEKNAHTAPDPAQQHRETYRGDHGRQDVHHRSGHGGKSFLSRIFD